jgi:transposase InsO family protein
LPEAVQKIIIDYRRRNPDHGFKRIEQHLRNRYFLVVARKRIRQVLKEADMLELHDSSFDRSETEVKGTRRFEAGDPGELYQMDITYVYITGLKVTYLINVLDDHSRFCLCSVLRFDQSAETLIEVLHDAIGAYGKPAKLLTDEGRAFYSWSGEKTKFQQYLDDQRIEHIVADPHSPTTTGKVERFHQSIKNELIRKVKFKGYTDAVEKIKAYVHHYNYERPHQGLDGARPADRFMGVNAGLACAFNELIDTALRVQKGYLIFKLGCYEVSVLLKSGEAPDIFVNGVGYSAHHREMN